MLPLLTICFSINYFSQVPPHKEYNYLCDMKLLHSIFFGLILLANIPQMVTAQTIIPLERGKGGVRSKTVDDYKEELNMVERQRNDSIQYVDNLRRAFNALHVDSDRKSVV